MKRQTGSGQNEQLEVTGAGGGSGGTVTQGPAGTDPWLTKIDPSQLPLPVSAVISTAGLSTSVKQDAQITQLDKVIRPTFVFDPGNNVVVIGAFNPSNQLEPLSLNNNSELVVSDSANVTPNSVFSGVKRVTTPGTRVQLEVSSSRKSVTVKALSTNTGMIFIGNSTVTSANGYQLRANEGISFDISSLGGIYIDASVGNDGVSYFSVS